MKQAETLVAQVPQAELMDEQQLNREVGFDRLLSVLQGSEHSLLPVADRFVGLVRTVLHGLEEARHLGRFLLQQLAERRPARTGKSLTSTRRRCPCPWPALSSGPLSPAPHS